MSCRVWAGDGRRDLPADWQETVVQRCREELRYLFNLSNDETRTGLYDFLDTLFAQRELQLEQVRSGDEKTAPFWREEDLWQTEDLLGELAARVRAGQTDSIRLYCGGGWQPPEDEPGGLYPHRTLDARPMPGDAEMAFLLERLDLGVEVVPMGQQAMVLFSWTGGDLAVYYDPVLDCFTGYSLQF